MQTPALGDALVVMAKAPRRGDVKTRLHGALGAERATALYVGFVRDTFALAASVRGRRQALEVTLCYAPVDGLPVLEPLVGSGILALPQRGTDLGARLENCFRDCIERAIESVVVVGADSPSLPIEYLVEAFDALARGVDLVLGPTSDGGYYLIGARRPYPALFEGIAWSTDMVYRETLARANAMGLEVHALREWYDVDVSEDLARLQADLANRPGCEATRAVLRSKP